MDAYQGGWAGSWLLGSKFACGCPLGQNLPIPPSKKIVFGLYLYSPFVWFVLFDFFSWYLLAIDLVLSLCMNNPSDAGRSGPRGPEIGLYCVVGFLFLV